MRRLAILIAFISLVSLACTTAPRQTSARQPTPRPSASQPLVFDFTFSLHQTGSGCERAQVQRDEQAGFQLTLSGGDGTVGFTFSTTAAAGSLATLSEESGQLILKAGAGSIDTATAGIDLQSFHLERAKLQLSASQTRGVFDRLQISDARLTRTQLVGDVVNTCVYAATADGRPDSTPPAVGIGGCLHTGCRLLADSAITVWFSEPVQIDQAAALVMVTDQNGKAVRFTADHKDALALQVHGAWPLGGSVTIGVAPGVQDRAGNAASAGAAQSFNVVGDPGPLGNAGFESGDLSGYSALLRSDYTLMPPADPISFFGDAQVTVDQQARVVSSFHGVQPGQGSFMLALGTGQSCAAGEIALTARVHVPAGAQQLVLDFNLLNLRAQSGSSNGGYSLAGGRPLIAASLRLDDGSLIAPAAVMTDGQPADLAGGGSESGWRQFSVPVGALAGQDAVLTLRFQPDLSGGPPPFCEPGVLLVDNLRFA